METYPINKGIGRSVEFQGLKSQYLFIFAGGLLALFVLFVILYMAGVNQWICIGFGGTAASILVWQTFSLNRKYGEHGLMKRSALHSHPPIPYQPTMHSPVCCATKECRDERGNIVRTLTKKKRRKDNEKRTESHHAGKPLPATCRRRGGASSRRTPTSRSPFGWTCPNSIR